MEEFKDKVQTLVDGYRAQLAARGIQIAVSKRYYETNVEERNTYHPEAGVRLLNSIDRYLDKKAEKKYHYQRNKYHCIILTIQPSQKGIVRKEDCRDYAFMLQKVERAHIGLEPTRVIYEENWLLGKIEKRIQKILKKAEVATAEAVCKSTFFDAIRYASLKKYQYKQRFLGKERFFWEILFFVSFSVIGVLAIIGILTGLGKLFY